MLIIADQWKEFFYCESIPKEVLVTKGQKRITGRSSNTKGNDNIISNGSGIAVADGQCMIIVEQGKIVEFCAEPGEFTWNNSTEPSIFAGNLGESIKETFKVVGKRFTYGGDTGKDQRVYYFNMKEILDNKFGTANPVPFRVVDSKIGLDIDVSIRCAGVYSYKIADPMLFYKNVCGNVESDYERGELDSTLKSEFISAHQPAFGKLSDLELRPNQIVSHNTALENAMNESLTDEQWHSIEQCLRGCRHSPPPIRHCNEAIYDETDSCLSVCWKISDGGSISVKYDGRKEEALCELLKSLLPDSEEEES